MYQVTSNSVKLGKISVIPDSFYGPIPPIPMRTRNNSLFLTFYFVLEYSWLTMFFGCTTKWFSCLCIWSEVKWSEVAQPCPTLRDPMDCSLLGSSIHGIFQERILEWGAIAFSRGSSRPRDWTWVSCSVGRRLTFWATREALVGYMYLFFFQIIFPFRLLYNTEQSSLPYTVGPCLLSI